MEPGFLHLQVLGYSATLHYQRPRREERGHVSEVFVFGDTIIITLQRLEVSTDRGRTWKPTERQCFRRISWRTHRLRCLRPHIRLLPRSDRTLPSISISRTK